MNTQLIPWYVNGTLDATEREAVEGELMKSETLRAELALWRAIADDVARERRTATSDGVDLGWRRLERQLPAHQRPTWRRWQMAAAASLVAIIGAQSLYLVHLERAHREDIRQLGAEPGGLGANEWRVQLRFRESATIAEINKLLFDADARVIAGPSALGLYEVAVTRSGRFPDANAAAAWFAQQSIVEQGTAPP